MSLSNLPEIRYFPIREVHQSNHELEHHTHLLMRLSAIEEQDDAGMLYEVTGEVRRRAEALSHIIPLRRDRFP